MTDQDMIDWVAENVMGFERKRCAGLMGGATYCGGIGMESTWESFFICDTCNQKWVCGESIPPCPKYQFPEFSLEDLMRKMGEKGYFVFVRVDALREQKRFTVMIGSDMRRDTDDPLKTLCRMAFRTLLMDGDDD